MSILQGFFRLCRGEGKELKRWCGGILFSAGEGERIFFMPLFHAETIVPCQGHPNILNHWFLQGLLISFQRLRRNLIRI